MFKTESYYAPVYTGIFKHYQKIKDALWLFIWYIDKVTMEEDATGGRVGHVRRGAPVKDSEAAQDMGCHRATVSRWRLILEAGGYIKTKSTPVGHKIQVLKSRRKSAREYARGTRKDAPSGRKDARTYRQYRDDTVTKRATQPLTDAEKRILAWQESLRQKPKTPDEIRPLGKEQEQESAAKIMESIRNLQGSGKGEAAR